jgi:RNA polymerase sigma factor (TIGR02999 family)
MNTNYDLIYNTLLSIARRERRRFKAGQTMTTRALVHEAYLSMQQSDVEPFNFYAYAASTIRNFLLDAARSRARMKHGGEHTRVDLGELDHIATEFEPDQLIFVDQALTLLAQTDSRAAQVMELYSFAGLNIEQIANLLKASDRTINRDLRFARAWLQQFLENALK